MRPNLTHLLVATALLAAPAAFGVAAIQDGTTTDTFDTAQASHAGEAEAPQKVETFEGEVPEEVTDGILDLRIDHGAVEIVAWEKDTYRIDVLAANESDGDTQTEFDETVEDDTISLSLVVDHQAPTGLSVAVQDENVGDTGQRAIQAHVPQSLVYQEIHACEGQSSSSLLDGVTSYEDEACVESSDGAITHGTINVDAQNEGLDVQWGMHGLEGEQAAMKADNGAIALSELDFATLAVETDNGDVTGTDLTVETLQLDTDNGEIDLAVDAEQANVTTDNGDVTLEGDIASLEGDIASLTADSDNGDVGIASPILSEGAIETDNGDVVLAIQPATSGQLDLATDNGDVDVRLGHDEEVGYAVTAVTDNGDVQLALVDQEEQETESDTEDEGDENDPGEQRTARTSGYESMAVQLAIDAETDNGAIEIVEETAQTEDDADDSGESSAGLTLLG